MRPWQWIKNIFVLPALLFSGKLLDQPSQAKSALAVLAFCLISSVVYIINDVTDCKKDSYHPTKKYRPIASGQIMPGRAIWLALVLFVATAGISLKISVAFAMVIALYFVMQLFYSLGLKKLVILDVIIIASGFVLRAISGAVAIQVPFTPWLVICIFTLCLFMGFCKRYNEMLSLESGSKELHRQTLLEYSPSLLTVLITATASLAIMAFMLYSISERTVSHFGTAAFIYTVPVVIYCIFRFAAMSMAGRYDGPSDLAIRDVPLISGVAIWTVLAVLIVLKGHEINELCQRLYT